MNYSGIWPIAGFILKWWPMDDLMALTFGGPGFILFTAVVLWVVLPWIGGRRANR